MRVRVFDAIFLRSAFLLLFATSLAMSAFPQNQQQTTPVNPPLPRIPGASQGNGEDENPTMRHMQEQIAKSRNNQRQQQLVADTTKLLALATELKEEVDKTNKDTLSLNVVKKAEEIEKLAKAVKEKMRDAQ
jgi:hypothetical protein